MIMIGWSKQVKDSVWLKKFITFRPCRDQSSANQSFWLAEKATTFYILAFTLSLTTFQFGWFYESSNMIDDELAATLCSMQWFKSSEVLRLKGIWQIILRNVWKCSNIFLIWSIGCKIHGESANVYSLQRIEKNICDILRRFTKADFGGTDWHTWE